MKSNMLAVLIRMGECRTGANYQLAYFWLPIQGLPIAHLASLVPTSGLNLVDDSRETGLPESAGINRHVVGDARALQERK